MCELFGMSSRQPTTVHYSMQEFAQHGGNTGPHRDGWGVAYYDEGDVRLIREPKAAAGSPYARFIEELDLNSSLVISHIRKATQGERSLRNTQPFVRELGGRQHVFAHNGILSNIESDPNLALGTYWPVGETDSEQAFCALMKRLQPLWLVDQEQRPSFAKRFDVVAKFAEAIAPLGPANFLYSDGDVLFAHGNMRTQTDGTLQPPGLWFLRRSCAREIHGLEATGLRIGPGTSSNQEVVLFASVPVTDEDWTPLAPGEVIAASQGTIVYSTNLSARQQNP